jgi:replicative superfamily II helicase
MATLKDQVQSLTFLILNGDTIRAMELYYSDDVEKKENEELPIVGKQECIDIERSNQQKLKEVHSKLLNQAVDTDKNVVFSEWEYIYTYKDNRKFLLRTVSVQQWVNGLITREKYYYKTFTQL